MTSPGTEEPRPVNASCKPTAMKSPPARIALGYGSDVSTRKTALIDKLGCAAVSRIFCFPLILALP